MKTIENPMIKEPPAQYTIGYMDMVSKREKIPGIERFIKLWEKAEHERQSKTAEEHC